MHGRRLNAFSLIARSPCALKHESFQLQWKVEPSPLAAIYLAQWYFRTYRQPTFSKKNGLPLICYGAYYDA